MGAEMKRLKPAIPIILFSGLPEAPPGSDIGPEESACCLIAPGPLTSLSGGGKDDADFQGLPLNVGNVAVRALSFAFEFKDEP